MAIMAIYVLENHEMARQQGNNKNPKIRELGNVSISIRGTDRRNVQQQEYLTMSANQNSTDCNL